MRNSLQYKANRGTNTFKTTQEQRTACIRLASNINYTHTQPLSH